MSGVLWTAWQMDKCCAGELNRAAFLRRRMERPRLADMAEDFGVLAAELERCFGEAPVLAGGMPAPAAPAAAPGGTRVISGGRGGGDAAGVMPTRAQLRATARTDLEKAIAAHGGPAAVAGRLGWRLPYKARGPPSAAIVRVQSQKVRVLDASQLPSAAFAGCLGWRLPCKGRGPPAAAV